MEPEGSLPNSQVPATCLYPEPARCSPYLHIPLREDPSSFIETTSLLPYRDTMAVCSDIHKIRKGCGQNVELLVYPRGA